MEVICIIHYIIVFMYNNIILIVNRIDRLDECLKENIFFYVVFNHFYQ